MDPSAELHLLRAENELITAQILFEISQNMQLQKEQFKLERQFTFYSATISHAYYCIFFAAKSILWREGIKTEAPEVHKKTLEAFKTQLSKDLSAKYTLTDTLKTLDKSDPFDVIIIVGKK